VSVNVDIGFLFNKFTGEGGEEPVWCNGRGQVIKRRFVDPPNAPYSA
jgi:hypothetical protein